MRQSTGVQNTMPWWEMTLLGASFCEELREKSVNMGRVTECAHADKWHQQGPRCQCLEIWKGGAFKKNHKGSQGDSSVGKYTHCTRLRSGGVRILGPV